MPGRGAAGPALVALPPVTSFLPPSRPAEPRRIPGESLWGVAGGGRSAVSLSLSPLPSPGGQSRGPPPPLPRRRGGAGAGGAVVPPAPGEGQIGHRRLAAGGGDGQAGGWPLVVETGRRLGTPGCCPNRSPWAPPPPFPFPLPPSGIVVNRCRPGQGTRLPRGGGSLPHPVCLRPGANPASPALFCVSAA